MRLLFDVNHPVQAHMFRPVIAHFGGGAGSCRVVARDKDVALPLLARMGIPARTLGPVGRGLPGRVAELLRREAALLALCRRERPHLIIGTSVHAARVAVLTGARSVVTNDDDAAAVPWFRWLAYPLASAIVTPECLRHEAWGARHHTYRGNQQLFYLHPSRFTPDPAVRAELGLREGERYAVVRLSAREAHHDRGVRGVGAALVEQVAARVAGRVRLFLSTERDPPPGMAHLELHVLPERLHHVLAFADFCLGDSQTVTAEAAVLGTPALRLNDFVGRISYLRELEGYGLAHGFRPGQEADLLALVDGLVAGPSRPAVYAERRARLLAEVGDPLPWFCDLLRAEASRARVP